MRNDLHHDRLSLPEEPSFKRKAGFDIEVWHNPSDQFTPAVVSLHIEQPDDPWAYVDLLPNEARAVAALLINAAEHQERRSKGMA